MASYNRKKVSGILYLSIAYLTTMLTVGNYFAFEYSDLVSTALHQPTSRRIKLEEGSTQDSDYYKSNYSKFEDLIKDETDFAKRATAEGSVLLQNKGLPLTNEKNITLLGVGSKDNVFLAGGGGSGAVNTSRAASIADSFKAVFNVNPTALSFYQSQGEKDPAISEVTNALSSDLTSYNDAAIIFIGRAGREGNDLTAEDLKLRQNEKDLIDYACQNFRKTVVILNTMNPMELGELESKENLSILWIGGTGEVMTGAIPEILNGTRYPSGKTVDTYAYHLEDHPSMQNVGDFSFSNLDASTLSHKYVNYSENIYIGYRYFETRYADKVLNQGNAGTYSYSEQVQYPFGYGLSYTTFEYSDYQLKEENGKINVSVKVTNTGSHAGKEAVEFYMSSPYTAYDRENGVEKSAVELVGFTKTKELKAGESETVSYDIDREVMKAYDSKKAKTYIVDDGTYYFATGKDSHDALNNILAYQGYTKDRGMTENGNRDFVRPVEVKEFDDKTYSKGENSAITNQFEDADFTKYFSDSGYLTRKDWTGTYPKKENGREAPTDIVLNPSFVEDSNAKMPTTGQNNGLVLASMLSWNGDQVEVIPYEDGLWDDLLDQMTPEEMMMLVAHGGYGTYSASTISKPETTDNDGPAGFSGIIMGGSNTFGYPTEVLLASSYNVELMKEMGNFVGEDGLFSGNTGWYAPGINIHRSPIGGRNFEYPSEDPFLAGEMISSLTDAAQRRGIVCYTKHFALNEQETNRSTICTFATEQSIREIYLKGFETVVRKGHTMGIMNSMNRIGFTWTGSYKNLLSEVTRNEWGYQGTMITDACSRSAKVIPEVALVNGNDLFLTTGTTCEIENYKTSPTLMSALRNACHRILYTYVQSNAMNGYDSNTISVHITPAWQIALVSVDFVAYIGMAVGLVFITIGLVKKDSKKKEEK